ncbi:hypothetical protein BDV98DRAFT_566751 [Pterulicium gracile]|uniref:DUF6535 domain-containing protein n=1 Tax=Pterulicium gracile TaxID=1884261 RepID=A0A5C3QUY8_9AGAR|nr:hypothetical protein BDV98DRAFT_566751 [Pterula gracilis]
MGARNSYTIKRAALRRAVTSSIQANQVHFTPSTDFWTDRMWIGSSVLCIIAAFYAVIMKYRLPDLYSGTSTSESTSKGQAERIRTLNLQITALYEQKHHSALLLTLLRIALILQLTGLLVLFLCLGIVTSIVLTALWTVGALVVVYAISASVMLPVFP